MRVCISDPFYNCDRIYPIQQSKVKAFLDELLPNDNVSRVLVFGSSVTDRCHSGSDLDVYVEIVENEEKLIRNYLPFEFDLWTNFMVDERLKKEIEKTGVIVYERNITR